MPRSCINFGALGKHASPRYSFIMIGDLKKHIFLD